MSETKQPARWEGQPKAGEHRTLGARAWCHDCKSYCYPVSMECDCCMVVQGYVRLWWRPDGVIVDDNSEAIAEAKR